MRLRVQRGEIKRKREIEREGESGKEGELREGWKDRGGREREKTERYREVEDRGGR